jgi:hypothetical protein
VGEALRQGGRALHGDSMGGLASQSAAGRRGEQRQEAQKGACDETNRALVHGGRLKKCGCGVIVASRTLILG